MKIKTKPILVYFSEHERAELSGKLGDARISPWIRDLVLRTIEASPELAKLDPGAVVRPLFACAVCIGEKPKLAKLEPWGLVCADCRAVLAP